MHKERRVLQEARKTFVFVPPQVINIINAAQESSPVTVAEALDRVLEILRTTELYSPQLASKEDDPHTNDLVGGLMNVTSSIKIYMFILIMLYDYPHLWFSVTSGWAAKTFWERICFLQK